MIWKRTLRGGAVVAALALGSGLAGVVSAQEPEDDAVLPLPPACEGELELIGIVYVVEDPERSMAMVGTKGSNLVRVGSWLGDRQILDIGPRLLVMGPEEDPCLMRLTDRTPVRKVRRTPRRRRRSRRRR